MIESNLPKQAFDKGCEEITNHRIEQRAKEETENEKARLEMYELLGLEVVG